MKTITYIFKYQQLHFFIIAKCVLTFSYF